MWQTVNGEEAQEYAKKSADLMRNADGFRSAMAKAIEQWPYSCEHNLSAMSCNRRAWLGHAGCYLNHGSPENATRLGWHMLNVEQQMIADAMADEVIEEWEEKYAEDRIGN
jgi:hypothetical protein